MRIDGKDSEFITQAFEVLRKQYTSKFAQIFKTTTSDNGSEPASLVAVVASEEKKDFLRTYILHRL